MVFQYYPETDMLYIKLADDVSAENRVIGIEIEDAAKHIDLTRLEVSALPVAQLVLTQQALA